MGSLENYDYDLVTIGAGSGGTRASRISAQHYGAKVACVELPFGFLSSDEIGGAGGTCVIRGCVPKKILVYGSAFAEEFRDANGFGWGVNQHPPHDLKNLIKKKSAEVERLNGVYNKLLKTAGVDLIEGRGKLLDAHTVEVTTPAGEKRILKTKYILLAVGGKPVKAPIPGSEHAITSDDALVLDDIPGSTIVIVGAGYISVEFSSIYKGLGAEVHLMYRKPLPLTGFDEECREQVADGLKGRGVHLYPDTTPTRIEKEADGTFKVYYKNSDGESSVKAGIVMFGTGRSPNTKNIGLEEVGVKKDQKDGIEVDEHSRTSVPNIYAIGDVTNRVALTPVAIMEGMAFAKTVFGKDSTPPDYRKVPSACFVQPPLAYVGFTEEEAIEKVSGNIDVYVSKFKPMKNTISGRDERTFMKLLVHSDTDQVLGAHMVGPDAPEVMQGIAIALKAGAKKAHFDSTVGIHPTAAEEWVSMRTRARRVQGQGKQPPS
ncbi:g2113 [Coccomyxa viridis]|uniref:G2113 protein n=1 Tax=Coccomyxa viridis TaxID=1274662 RepID=A0ABP1FL76_9CHLO